MWTWLKKNSKSIALVVSLILNALGGAGIVPPVVTATGNTILDQVK